MGNLLSRLAVSSELMEIVDGYKNLVCVRYSVLAQMFLLVIITPVKLTNLRASVMDRNVFRSRVARTIKLKYHVIMGEQMENVNFLQMFVD